MWVINVLLVVGTGIWAKPRLLLCTRCEKFHITFDNLKNKS